MYKQIKANKTTLRVNKSYEGETIEQKINRIVNNKEPIKDGAPVIYTERKDGVLPQYDIRTDRFEIAVEAMDVVTKSNLAKREHSINERGWTKDEKTGKYKRKEQDQKKNGGAEPIQGTGTSEGTQA
ncbi:MAG: hypothetical protein [Microviridae sp.]|nr:MAG: hypothetical protein [Microviridae sp.]